MVKVIGLLTRLFMGKEIAILLRLLLLVPKTVRSVEPLKDGDGKFIYPFPSPNVETFAAQIYKLVPKEMKSENGGPASLIEAKNCAFFLAKAYQSIRALFN